MAVPDYFASIQFTDSTSDTSTMTLYLTGDRTLALAKLDNITTALAAISESTVSQVLFTQIVSRDATVPAGHVDNGVKGKFTFKNADNVPMTVSVPGINEALVLPNSKLIDMEDGDVLAFVNQMIIGNIIVDSREIDITAFVKAIEVP